MVSFKSSLLSVFLVFSFASAMFSQSSYDEEFKNKEYDKIERKLLRDYAKATDDLMANYDMSLLFNESDYSKFNPDTAYYFGKMAESIYTKLSSKQREKLIRNSIYLSVIRDQVLKVCVSLFDKYAKEQTVEAYNYYIDNFGDSQDLISRAIEERNELAFDLAQKNPTVEKYQLFITKYPNAAQVKDAIINRDVLEFNVAMKSDDSNDFLKFKNKHPSSHLLVDAQTGFDKALFYETVDFANVNSIIDFASKYPKSTYSAAIFDSIYFISSRNSDFGGLKFYVEKAPTGKYIDKAWKQYYTIYTKDGFVETLEHFFSEYKNSSPFTVQYQTDFDIAVRGRSLELENGYDAKKDSLYWKYMQLAWNKDLAFNVLQVVLMPVIRAKKWSDANLIKVKAESIFGKNDKQVSNLFELLSAPLEGVKIESLGNSVNTATGNEYVPIISADGKCLYFCGAKRRDNVGGEDVFVSESKNGTWQTPSVIKALATEGNDAPLSISTDGQKLLLFINGDIYYSIRTATSWGIPIKYPAPINTDAWEGDAMLTSDGNAIIFVSKREGGMNPLYQDRDVYVCTKTKNGWSEAINLGPNVNSPYTERSPYLHSDMKTLYFSSAGHGGVGDLDVYMTKRLNDSTWTNWSEPINLGKEINTIYQDWGYRVPTAGDKAYFSAENNNSNHDIFVATLPMKLRPYTVATLSGFLIGLDGNPIEGTIRWEDLETGNIIGESKSNPADGAFFIVLPLGKKYGYFVEKDGFFPLSKNIDLSKEVNSVTEVEKIILPSYDMMVNQGVMVPINNLFFGVDKSEILPSSFPELNRIAQIIKERNLRIEIDGHTDNSGTKEHNLALSEQRAKAVATFLVSKGIFMKAITTKGFGDEKPIGPNTTEQEKAKNRRVELKFIK